MLTLGGYNPGFTPPSHYPTVPAVGFHWTLDSSISITGSAYLALTPAVMMAGAELDATYQSGNLKAWFIAHADAIIRWKPFWMDVDIGVVIGASYVLSFAGVSKTVSVELGCDLEFWGPPSGGTVTVNWNVISFTIAFGAANTHGQGIGGWSDIEAMLPNAGTSGATQLISLKAASGLIVGGSNGGASARQGAADGDGAWSVRGSTFGFTTAIPVPISSATVGSAHAFTGSSFNVYPLGWGDVSAAHAITITDAQGNDCSASFDAAPSLASVPAALWGSPPEDQNGNPVTPAADQQLVTGQITGVSVTVKPPGTGNTAGPVNVAQELAYDDLELSGAVVPLSAGAVPSGDVAVNNQTTIGIIADATSGIASPSIAAIRSSLLQGLSAAGYAPPTANDPMTGFAGRIGHALAASPLLVA